MLAFPKADLAGVDPHWRHACATTKPNAHFIQEASLSVRDRQTAFHETPLDRHVNSRRLANGVGEVERADDVGCIAVADLFAWPSMDRLTSCSLRAAAPTYRVSEAIRPNILGPRLRSVLTNGITRARGGRGLGFHTALKNNALSLTSLALDGVVKIIW